LRDRPANPVEIKLQMIADFCLPRTQAAAFRV
jgi:hypothetical protein